MTVRSEEETSKKKLVMKRKQLIYGCMLNCNGYVYVLQLQTQTEASVVRENTGLSSKL